MPTPSGGDTPEIPPSDSSDLIEGRNRVYLSEQLAITRWVNGKGQHSYQITSRDPMRRRQGDGYLVLTPTEMAELGEAIKGMLW